jgi:hypothetical protein
MVVFVALYTIPVSYEKYEDKVDAFGEKAMYYSRSDEIVALLLLFGY